MTDVTVEERPNKTSPPSEQHGNIMFCLDVGPGGRSAPAHVRRGALEATLELLPFRGATAGKTAAIEAVGNSCSNGDGGDGDMAVWDFISARPPPRRRCARLLSHLPDGGVALTALTPVRSAATLWGGGRGVSGVGLRPLSRLHRTI